MNGRSLEVSINARPVGCLRESDGLWAFDYHPAWAAAPDGFDLSPALPRSQRTHADGASLRPVQWYFDNLLPEEALRVVVAKEAQVDADDSFGLLAHFGAESAGSLVLLPPGQPTDAASGLRPLPDNALSRRIGGLPRISLNHEAPKHMSLAGAQHKLPVVWRGGQLFEPYAGEASTHILKPEHPDQDVYPATVANEYFVMRLALALGLPVARVVRRHVPQAVYLVERFDRTSIQGQTLRLHLIDACQLLNKARSFKYRAATVATLAELARHCRVRPAARRWLFEWLVFNILVGNGDNHLKNISFLVSADGVAPAPAYDLLSTAAYTARAVADTRATWPATPLALALPGREGRKVETFHAVTREALLDAAGVLEIPAATAERLLDGLVERISGAADALLEEIGEENRQRPDHARHGLAMEGRVLRTVRFVVIRDMARRLWPPGKALAAEV